MRYLEPETVDEALDLLAEHGERAKVIAGGQSLLILMRERLVDFDVLIGLRRIESLRRLEVGNRGTLGANVAHASQTADPPAALIASDARVHVAGKRSGARAIPAED